MLRLQLRLRLESDTTFGRGEGLAGLIDEEVEYDLATGLPFVRGRTLKGLLVEECANLMYALQAADAPALLRLQEAAARLFGSPGSGPESAARLHIGPALLPQELSDAVHSAIEHNGLSPTDVLESLTAIRHQTAIDEQSAAPEEHSLRSMRVVVRQTEFSAWLDFDHDPATNDLELLAACVFSARHGGMGRNRGRGRLSLRLLDESGTDVTMTHFEHFKQLVAKGQA